MNVTPINRTEGAAQGNQAAEESSQLELRRTVVAGTRMLNDLRITNRNLTVARDPDSHRFIVLLLNRTTGEVIDQFPPENIVKVLSQLAEARKPEPGDLAK